MTELLLYGEIRAIANDKITVPWRRPHHLKRTCKTMIFDEKILIKGG